MSDLASPKKFQFVGGNLALDFCNTVGGKRGVVDREYLDAPLQFVGWCHQAGLMNEAQAQSALRRADANPEEAKAVLARAVKLRESMFRIFSPLPKQRSPGESDLALLNAELSRALCRLRLVPSNDQGSFGWEWVLEGDALDQLLGPIAHAAANLLTDSHALAQVRMCQGDTCGWLFIDASRNHSRCWCDMRDCGNRAKVRRHRQRLRNCPAG